jgi:hypothetical protein
MENYFQPKEDSAFATSKFRSSNRKRLIKGLFYETTGMDKSTVLYTLKDEDHLGYPSLARLYLETGDPTEYKFAIKYFESYDHWLQISSADWFVPYLNSWRRELEVKMKSEALANIIEESRNKKSASFFTVNKFIVDKGWEPKEGQTKRGRPSKDEISAEAYRIANERDKLDEDFERLGIRAN